MYVASSCRVSVVPLPLDPPNPNHEEEVMDSEALVYIDCSL
jgi:hypothetical protein